MKIMKSTGDLRIFILWTEATTRGALCKRMFLQISQNSQEKSMPESIFNKVAGLGTGVFL